MTLDELVRLYRPAVEDELRKIVRGALVEGSDELVSMLAYHMGWEGEGAGPEAQGKRIRPILTLLCASSSGSDWRLALPAAASVELIHNFSLIHDDIQDQSPLRRGRPTVWTKWGVPQAINAGDLLFTVGNQALLGLAQTHPPAVVVEATQIMYQTCIRLTQGQYLDISYENRGRLALADYWPMVAGKTAALLSCCCELGALAAGVEAERQQNYQRFGYSLGLAFQAVDDWLGIWGDHALTGKSTASDLLSGKKTLPVLFGLQQDKQFARRWERGNILPEEVPQLAEMLAAEGARQFTEVQADHLTSEALEALERAVIEPEAGGALRELAGRLLKRQR